MALRPVAASFDVEIALARGLQCEVDMDRCQTILPPPPPAMTTLRASVGALWFRVFRALGGALRRASRPPRRARLDAAEHEVCTPVLVGPVGAGGTEPMSAEQVTLEDDKWLRPTQVLPQRG